MNILFLNVGRRCELVDSFRRSLALRGDGVIHGSDITEHAPGLYKVDQAHLLPHGSSPEFVDSFCSLCREHDIGLVIPTIDPDLEHLSTHAPEISARCPGTRLLLSPPETITICRDKRLARDRFAALGAEVPCAVDVDDPALTFPIFMKPARGSASQGVHLICNREELVAFRPQCSEPMFEEVVGGPEYTVDVLCDFTGHSLFAVPRRRIRVRAGEVTQGVVERSDELESLAMRLAEGFGCHGPVTLQFRLPPADSDARSRFVAMEVNARMGGGLPLTIAAGADWPGWIIDLTAGQAPNLSARVRDGLMILRYDASVFVETRPVEAPTRTKLEGVGAVIFDLDDTLYPERDFVFSGYRAVAERVYADHGIDIEPVLRAQFDKGIRRDVFGIALRRLNPSEDYLRTLVAVYREHLPQLRPHVGIAALSKIRDTGRKLALLTDGLSAVQRNKVASLGIESLFDVIVYTHDLGGHATWKPSIVPFEACLRELAIEPSLAVYVADNPHKDFRGARQVGIRTVRIRHPGGEHASAEPQTRDDAPDLEVLSLAEFCEIIELE